MSGDAEDLAGLSAELTAKIKEIAATDHIGHQNRLYDQRSRIFAQIAAHPDGGRTLAGLLADPDPQVQLAVAQLCKLANVNLAAAVDTLQGLAAQPGSMGAEARGSLETRGLGVSGLPSEAFAPSSAPFATPNPARFPFLPQPAGCSQAQAEEIIRATPLPPEKLAAIRQLLRPSIRIWPKPLSDSPIASRWGGLPAVPPGWDWPLVDEEPFVFVAQVNCAELGPLAVAFGLPSRGLLSFFGDHDDINGVPANGGAVFYFDDEESLGLHDLPMEEDEPLASCGMGFYPSYDLPAPSSEEIQALGISGTAGRQAWEAYGDLYLALATFGFDAGGWLTNPDDVSKLFGWPDLVQGDLYRYGDEKELLLQLGSYTDGAQLQAWGPGGLLYFQIQPQDLAARDFSEVELEVQCT